MKPCNDQSLDPALRKLISAGRADLPTREQLGAFEKGVLAVIAGGATGAALGTGATAAAAAKGTVVGKISGLFLTWKTLAVVAVAGIGSATYVVATPGSEDRADDVEPPALVRAAPLATNAEHDQAALALPVEPSVQASDTKETPTSLLTLGAPSSSPKKKEPTRTRQQRPANSAAQARSLAKPLSSPEPTNASEDNQGEAALLRSAQDSITDKPAKALALANQHKRRFASGVLQQEREFLAVQALIKLGRIDAAKKRAGQFRKKFPWSAHRRRLKKLLEGLGEKSE